MKSRTIRFPKHIEEAIEKIVEAYLYDEHKDHEQEPHPQHIYHSLKAVSRWLPQSGVVGVLDLKQDE